MMTIAQILEELGDEVVSFLGSEQVEISNIVSNSKVVNPGDLFVAINGSRTDAREHIVEALEKGAKALVVERSSKIKKNAFEGNVITVKDARKSLAILACSFYDHPSKKLKLIGVTGTNGKTSIATFLHQSMNNLGYKSGLLSTVMIAFDGGQEEASLTTPAALEINRYLSEMVKSGVTHCFMEVSSHGIDQYRVFGLSFVGGVFTNLTQDHLDYHGDFKTYRDTKKRFFDGLSPDSFAITNIDDKNGSFILQNTKAKKMTCSIRQQADYKAKAMEKSFSGTLAQIDGEEVWTKLLGSFNVMNLLQTYACLRALDIEKLEALKVISNVDPAKGRFQIIEGERICGIVEHAHTPDSLKKVMEAIQELKDRDAQFTVVFGCGGDRDKEKRPQMGQVATELADKVVITSDNSRGESPKQIMEDIFLGIDQKYHTKVAMIEDREEAIRAACMMTEKKGIVLVAGKGHETYQEEQRQKIFFSDEQVLRTIFES